MTSFSAAGGIDYDVYDSAVVSPDGSRGGYLQKVGVALGDRDTWRRVCQSVLEGKLDEAPNHSSNAIAVGALRWFGSLWLYRFRIGLRDSHGRLGRVVFVLVRCPQGSDMGDPRIGRLLGAAAELRGVPINIASLESVFLPNAEMPSSAREAAAVIATQREDLRQLRDTEHIAVYRDAATGQVRKTQLVRLTDRAPKPQPSQELLARATADPDPLSGYRSPQPGLPPPSGRIPRRRLIVAAAILLIVVLVLRHMEMYQEQCGDGQSEATFVRVRIWPPWGCVPPEKAKRASPVHPSSSATRLGQSYDSAEDGSES